MMGDSIKCPSCCDKVFESKSQLIEHLAHLLGEIACPICNNKWSSLGHLVEHLTLDSCHHDSDSNIFDIEPYTPPVESQQSGSPSNQLMESKLDLLDNVSDPLPYTKDNQELATVDADDGKMYIEFLSKQLTRSCLQTQQIKLVKEDNGIGRYVFITDDDTVLEDDSTIVTKQNDDGTISLTAVKDMPKESDTLITQENNASDTLITQESDAGDNHHEIYSCNTCGVSFTSVLEHIQNYHNDQEVVVEDVEDRLVEDTESDLVNLNSMAIDNSEQRKDSIAYDQQGGRRMITDNGHIVDAPIMSTASNELDDVNTTIFTDNTKPEPMFYTVEDVKQEANKTDYPVVTIKKQTELPKEPDERKSGPYHKVVQRELTISTGQRVRMFQCISCQTYVSNLDDFKQKPCKPPKFRCSQCPVGYSTAKSLCAHMKVHKNKTVPGTPVEAPSKPVTYDCEVCLTVFTTNKSLKLHKRMHDPIKERPIDPPVETAAGGEASTDKYLCSVCNKHIPIDYRTIHQNSHKNLPKFNCDICNKKFTSRDYLDMHISVHNIDKIAVGKQDESLPYLCVFCDRRFARPHEKVKHERIHTGEKPHSCEICGKSFRVSYCLTLHMRTHTGARPYACPHCGKRFKAHSVYNHHLLTHSDVRAYKCPYCPKAFKTSVQLAGHKNSHTKPFSCQHCNRPFASLYAVRVHTETHTRQNNLKFSCTVCGASYARAFALKDHVKQAHSNEDVRDDGPIIMEIFNANEELPVP